MLYPGSTSKGKTEMKRKKWAHLPHMLYADKDGQIYDHPYYRMAGMSGEDLEPPLESALIPLAEFGKLFYFPNCPPIGYDPEKNEYVVVREIETDTTPIRCFAVAAFMEPGEVRSLLPAVDYSAKDMTLPMWAYTAVGFRDDAFWTTGFRVEYNHRWDPQNFDDRDLIPAIAHYKKTHESTPLLEHLSRCATRNHCFAAKNLFLERWEAPLPVSRTCNAACLGCLSLQTENECRASHQRISFRPSKEEIIHIAVRHIQSAPEAIVSFGQGCEGEPLTESGLIADSIQEIRHRTSKGTINLNTNGSKPKKIKQIIENGLDSIRISLNSARKALYHAYYRPKDYQFEDVIDSIALSRKMGVYTMINYLVFPGISDQEEEIHLLIELLRKTGVDFLHMKNLCIDPQLYLEKMPKGNSRALGMENMASLLKQELPDLKLGYFNQAVR